MTPEQWQKAEKIFDAALNLPEEERDEFLVQACANDDVLLAEVRRLLAAAPPQEFIQPITAQGVSEAFAVDLDGRRFGDYRLLREIGRGGMGVVYLASHEDQKDPIAIKLLPPAQEAGDARTRFDREISAASSLQHPTIVPVLEHGETDGIAWYAMRYIDGHDLHTELDAQRKRATGSDTNTLLPHFDEAVYLSTVASRFADLADAAQAAHDGGVVHRDIKPKNILLDDRGNFFLTDFGIARDEKFGTITKASIVQGTPYYMSPEQARALKIKVDYRTDIYSLSVVLYETLTLKLPFGGTSQEEVLEKIGRGVTTDIRKVNPKVPRDLALICSMGMSRRPSARYASAQDLAEDLRRFLRHEPVRAKPPSPRERMVDWVDRNRRMSIALVAVLLGLLIGVLANTWSQGHSYRSELTTETRAVLELNDWLAAAVRVGNVRAEFVAPQHSLDSELESLKSDFEQRLGTWRDASLATCRECLAIAKGGLTGQPGFGTYRTPPSPQRLTEAQAIAQRLAIVFPDDEEIAELTKLEATFPQIVVTAQVVDENGNARDARPNEAVVSIAPFDPIHDSIGEERQLGAVPLPPTPIAPGHYRIRVTVDAYGHADLMRRIEPSVEVTSMHARIHRREELVRDMVQVTAASLDLKTDHKIGCLILDDEVDVESFHLDRHELSNGRFMQFLTAASHDVPKMWRTLGYKDSWRDLPIAGFEDKWLDLPVVGITALDARACAEWYGMRLPRHVELELALDSLLVRGTPIPRPRPDIKANIDGVPSNTVDDDDHPGLYRNYLQNTFRVDDPTYRQEPLGVCHLFGNVTELTCSPMVEPAEQTLRVVTGRQVTMGGSWEMVPHKQSIHTHGWGHELPAYYSFSIGVRLAF